MHKYKYKYQQYCYLVLQVLYLYTIGAGVSFSDPNKNKASDPNNTPRRILYCGGNKAVLGALTKIQKKWGLKLSVESFSW